MIKAICKVLPALFLVAINATGVAAQTASGLTPDSFQPDNQRPVGRVEIAGPVGVEAPPGSDRLFVRIGAVRVSGGLADMASAQAAFTQSLTGRNVAVSQIFQAVAGLEAAYAQAGFVLVRVVLPAQVLLNGGTLQVEVINGFVEQVNTAGVPSQAQARVTALTKPLAGRRALTLAEIERQLLLAGDTYGVSLSSALSAGVQPGGTVLTVDSEFAPVTGFVSLDNTVAENLGPIVLSAGVEYNGLLKQGETFYMRLSGAPVGNAYNGIGGFFTDMPRLRTISLGTVFPIGTDGLTLNAEATSSRSTPNVQIFPTTSRFDRLSLRLFYPWIRSRAVNLSSQFTLDVQSDDQWLVTGLGNIPLYQDQLTVLRASLDYSKQTAKGGRLDLGAVLSQGIDALGARRAGTGGPVPLSRQGADAVFTKLILSQRFQQQLNDWLHLSLSARAQYSFGDPLLNSERIVLASTQELSSFDAGRVTGDSGWVVRGELASPRPITLSQMPGILSPYLFAAYGNAYNEQPTLFEAARIKASSFGVGLDFSLRGNSQFSSGSVRVEFGRGKRSDFGSYENRFTITASYRF